MHRTPKVIIAPDVEPITIEEARLHLEAARYEDSDVDPADDTQIMGWVAAAREYCEGFTGLSFATQTLEIALDSFPITTDLGGLGIDLPGGPVREVVSISWGDESDEELDAADFVLDTFRHPHQVKPTAAAWPVLTASTNLVRIRYLAGYGVDSDGGEVLPKILEAGLRLVLGHLYRNREATTAEALALVPIGIQSLLRQRRERLGMA